MHYILAPNIGLRAWWRTPYAYYVKGVRDAKRLTGEEYELLRLCDGRTEVPEGPLTESLLKRGFIRKCAPGEASLEPWQDMVCENRYFPAMNWMITGRCNYNCLHCFNASDNAPLMSEFSLEEAEKLLDQARECGINAFTITGGEPMCHKHFFEILEGICRRNMFVEELNTNGFYLNQTALDRLRAMGCNPLIKISFDGLGHHDWLRNRKGAEADALRAIRLCVANGFRVKVQTNVHRWNLDTMLPTARLLDEIGVEEMRIIRTTEVPRWNENAQGATLELGEYYDGMLAFAKAFISESHCMKIDIWQFLTLYPRQKCYRMRPVECGPGEYRDSIPVCRGNRGMVAVSANGNVFPCMQMSGYYEARKDILGNVKQMGLRPLLQAGPYLAEVCTTLGDLARANEQCGSCEFFKHCAGGCRAIALTLTGNKLGVDPAKCLFYKAGYHRRIQALLEDWKNLAPITK